MNGEILNHVIHFTVQVVRPEHVPVLLANLLDRLECVPNHVWVLGTSEVGYELLS